MEVVKELLQFKSDYPDIPPLSREDPVDDAPLEMAVHWERCSIAELLLQHHFDINAASCDNLRAIDRTFIFDLHNRPWGKVGTKLELLKLLLSHEDIEVDYPGYSSTNPLANAAGEGRVPEVSLLLVRADVNWKDPHGRTALHSAALRGRSEIVRILLREESIDADAVSVDGSTPLMCAAGWRGKQDERLEVVRLILERAKILLRTMPQGSYALSLDTRPSCGPASNNPTQSCSDHKTVPYYCSININRRDNGGRSALSWAVLNEHLEIVELLLRCDDIDITWKDDKGRDLLMLAASTGNEMIMKLFLSTMDGPLSRDIDGETALFFAAGSNHLAGVQMLFKEQERSLEFQSGNWGAVLHRAASHAFDAELLQFLVDEAISRGVIIDAPDERGRTPLFYAAQRGPTDFARSLLAQSSVDPLKKDHHGCNIISSACKSECGQTATLELLLDIEGIQADHVDERGLTPLMYAVDGDFREAAELLLSRNDVDPFRRHALGELAPSRAADWCHGQGGHVFFRLHELDLQLPDADGRTLFSRMIGLPIDLAEGIQFRSPNVIDPDRPDKRGRTPLSWAAESPEHHNVWGDDDYLQDRRDFRILLEWRGVNKDAADESGRTPLSYAAERGHLANVNALLECSEVDPMRTDRQGRTPLDWAEIALKRPSVKPLWNEATEQDLKLRYKVESGHDLPYIGYDNVAEREGLVHFFEIEHRRRLKVIEMLRSAVAKRMREVAEEDSSGSD
ncbi:Uu.00g031670.m01.CDS01 [Anthostomella pinea]|uniref:Uu.00g031670.m01.CDS01 n=1 Tax=Anthostomella pinea TaxID=933095 RepID=A0AAI8V8I9_9PEZI|nr:Uu.00g031670.m01.CDS01 [Anthostomella pinea]